MARTRRSAAERAVIIHSIDHARAAAGAAAALGVPILLLSAPGAGGYAGAPWFLAIVDAVRAEFPAAAIDAALDCGDRPGFALAAIREGAPQIAFRGRGKVRAKVVAIAERAGVRVLSGRVAALDLVRSEDPPAACRAWFGGD